MMKFIQKAAWVTILNAALMTQMAQAETLTLTTASGQSYTYNGDVKNRQANGKGTQTFANGAKYVGEWKDNEFIGK